MKISISPTYIKALWLYKQKKWQAAANELQKIRKQDPDNAQALFKLGMCHYRLKQWIRAADRMTEALALAPQNQHWTVQQQKAVKESVKSKLTTLKANTKLSATQKEDRVRNLLALDYNNAKLHNELAHALRKQGKWWQEVEALTQATSLKPQFPTWHYRLGEALEAMNRFQQAAAAYGTAIELKKGKAEALWHYRQGFCYEREGHDGAPNPAAAQKAYQQATAKDATLNAKRYGIGVFHQSRGYWPQALAAYSQQWQKQPWDAELCYRTGMAHDRCYDWRQAEDWYKKALSILLDKPQWHYRLGFVLERQEKYLEAAQAYEYAATHAEKHTPYWFYRWGYVLDKAGQHEQAVQAFLCTKEQPTLDAPVDAPIYLQQVNSHQFIADTLEEVLRHDTTNPEHWYQLGNAYERLENWEKAADAYGHAVKRSNDHQPNWYYRLAYAQYKLSDFIRSAQTFEGIFINQLNIKNEFERIDVGDKYRLQKIYTYYRSTLSIINKTILFESFDGKSIGCNPYAVFREMLNNPEYNDWEYIWTVNDTGSIPAELKANRQVVFVKKESDPYLRALASCSHLVNNVVFRPYFHRRAEQKYLATWHGTPLKTLGKDQQKKFFDHRRAQRNFLQSTHLISPNKHTSKVFLESYQIKNLYLGKIAELGNARVDLTLNATKKRKVEILKSIGINKDLPIVLYSPTWRGDVKNAFIDRDRLEEDINKLTSEKYHLLFRGHPLTEGIINKANINCLRPPENLDSNELLSIVDVLITDYSSICFDFMPRMKPIIYYAHDEEVYRRERGLYFEFDELPGVKLNNIDDVALHLSELMKGAQIENSKYKDVISYFCGYDDGGASRRAISFFLKDVDDFTINKDCVVKNNNVLIAISTNDIYHREELIIGLVKAVKDSKLIPVIIFSPNEFEKMKSRDQFFGKLDDFNVVYLPRCGIPNLLHHTRQQYQAMRTVVGFQSAEAVTTAFNYAYSLELERAAGLKSFKYIIDCSNQNAYFNDLFLSLEKRGVSIHRLSGLIAYELKEGADIRDLFTRRNFDYSSKKITQSSFGGQASTNDLDETIDRESLQNFEYGDLDGIRTKVAVHLEGLHLSAKGYKFIFAISTPGFDTSQIKIEYLYFQQRKRVGNEERYLRVQIKKEELINNKYELEAEVIFEDVDVPLLYWELGACIGYFNRLGEYNKFHVNVNSLNKKLEEALDEYPLGYAYKIPKNDRDWSIIYPYINANERISFVHRERDDYDDILYRVREIIAKFIYRIAKRYWDSKNIWLVFEKNSKTAQDNGFYFFKKAVAQRPNVYYIVDKNSNDYIFTKKFKRHIVKFMTVRHMVYLLAASTLISSEARAHGYAWRRVFGEYRKALLSKHFVFLQHGVTALKNTKNIFSRWNKAFAADLFVVTSQKESRIVAERLGYSDEQLIIANFERWHDFKDKSGESKEIFLMPTWRNWLEEISEEEFLSSSYYLAYKNLIESPDLISKLERHNFYLNFILHPKLVKNLAHFKSQNSRIAIADTNKNTVRDLLSSAKILITDYSSVAWDFLYLKKPVIFYHFDRMEYEKYQGSYIDLDRELPGELASSPIDLIQMIDRVCGSYDEYHSRALSFHMDFFGLDISKRNSDGKVFETICMLEKRPT